MKAKVTQVQSIDPRATLRPLLAFIPGGPGISSATLRSMDFLSRSFDLAYVDPPGTGGLAEVADPTFYSVTAALEAELSTLKRPLVLCGHSFGALFGIELATRGNLDILGIVAIAAPISGAAYAVATEQYYMHMTPELEAAASRWDQSPSRETLTELFSSYGTLYFSPATVERGRRLLASDLVSARTFECVLPVLSQGKPEIDFIGMLNTFTGSKHMVAGRLDQMLPPRALRADAQATGCGFHEIAGAGHFVTFDQPEAVAGLLEELFIGSSKGVGK